MNPLSNIFFINFSLSSLFFQIPNSSIELPINSLDLYPVSLLNPSFAAIKVPFSKVVTATASGVVLKIISKLFLVSLFYLNNFY